MATSPNSIITAQTPNINFGATVTTANTAKDGTGTVVTAYTAGANGSKCDQINIMPLGTNTASVMRLFLNNGATNATPANNHYLKDVSLPATTNSEVASIGNIPVAIGLTMPAGSKIFVTIGTTVAAGFAVSGTGGDL